MREGEGGVEERNVEEIEREREGGRVRHIFSS